MTFRSRAPLADGQTVLGGGALLTPVPNKPYAGFGGRKHRGYLWALLALLCCGGRIHWLAGEEDWKRYVRSGIQTGGTLCPGVSSSNHAGETDYGGGAGAPAM